MLDVVDRLTLILTMLQQAVAQFLAREARGPYSVWLGTRHYVAVARRDPNAPPAPRPIPADTWRLLAARAERLAWRFRRLVEAWQAGTLPPPRPCRAPCPPRSCNAPHDADLVFGRGGGGVVQGGASGGLADERQRTPRDPRGERACARAQARVFRAA